MPSGETEPLLPRYEGNTTTQRRLHQKLHTYQMLRALSEGYMPSTEQTIANLRYMLASDILNSGNQDIGSVGRQLIRDCRLWISTVIELLQDKNGDDQLQEFLWHLSRSRASLDTSRIARHASDVRAHQDTKAAYDSLRTVGGLLLTNADFRILVDDLTTIGRQIFSDTAFALSESSQQAGEQLKPSQEQINAVQGAGADEGHTPSNEDLLQEATEVAEVAGDSVASTSRKAISSAREHLAGQERETVLYRLKRAITKLRERSDYTDSFSTLAQLVLRYAKAYADTASEVASTAEDEFDANADLKQAVEQFWTMLQSLGDPEEWKKLQQKFHEVLKRSNKDAEFESLLSEIGSSIKEMLTEPNFFDSAPKKVEKLKEKSKNVGAESRDDVDAFLDQAKRTLQTVREDDKVSKLIGVTNKIYKDAWDAYQDRKGRLPTDILEVFLPLLIRSIQYIPIPRLEISAPEMDLLVENLILEPGHTVNFSSFLPYRMHVTTRSDIDILKKHSKRTAAELKTTFTATVFGLNISASEFGYWIRTHTGLFHVKDQGIASFYLDRRGIDISLDVEVGRERLEQIFTIRGVRVRIYKLDYKVHQSRWKFLLWLTKPFLKHLVRRVLEKKIAEHILQTAATLNRELVFARERLRAARVANPPDLTTFVRAVLARMKPASDSDVGIRIGADSPRSGVFKNVYTPGSLVKVWQEEGLRAQEAIVEGDESGGLGRTWRNDIFNVGR